MKEPVPVGGGEAETEISAVEKFKTKMQKNPVIGLRIYFISSQLITTASHHHHSKIGRGQLAWVERWQSVGGVDKWVCTHQWGLVIEVCIVGQKVKEVLAYVIGQNIYCIRIFLGQNKGMHPINIFCAQIIFFGEESGIIHWNSEIIMWNNKCALWPPWPYANTLYYIIFYMYVT